MSSSRHGDLIAVNPALTGTETVIMGTPQRMRNVLAMAATAALCLPFQVQANPQDGRVVAGSATIVNSSANRLDVIQRSDKAVLDWRSFSIANGEWTDFQQPSASSIVLNRVTGGDLSSILGKMTANGMVVLSNPNGILFGLGSQVDVGGLVATTANIRTDDFMAGRMRFTIPSTVSGASVVNDGTITIAAQGIAALVAPTVVNSGIIQAKLGKVALGGGHTFTLDLYGDQLIQFDASSVIREKQNGALVSNSGVISADGGSVYLTAKAAAGVVNNVINMSGVVEAKSVDVRDGEIILSGGEAGIVNVTGTLDASGKGHGEKGGRVEVLGQKVALQDGARIDVSGDAGGGTALIGGDFQGKNSAVANADRSYVGQDVVIHADALGHGDGGKVIVWSNEVTGFAGTITACGKGGGHGGLVEVSGKKRLIFDGKVDTSAPGGKMGTLLLDPDTINITDSTSDAGAAAQLAAGAGTGSLAGQVLSDAAALNGDTTTSNFTGAQIVTQLGLTNVVLAAGSTINVQGTVDATTGGGGTSGHSLGLTAPTINFSSGAYLITNNADLNLSGNVVLNPGANTILATGGGNLTVTGTIAGAGGGATTLTLNAGSGTLSVNKIYGSGTSADTNGLTDVSVTSGDAGFNDEVKLSGALTVTNTGLFTLSSAGAIHAAGGFSTTGDAKLGNDVVTTNTALSIGGTLTLAEGANITLDTTNGGAGSGGALTISGTTSGTAGGSSEALTLRAGNESLNLKDLYGADGSASATGLKDVTIVSSGTTNFNGAIAITGLLQQSNAATGDTTFYDSVAVGSATLKGTTFTVKKGLDATGAIAITNSGLFTKEAIGAITAPDGFSATGNVSLANSITTTNGALTIGGTLTLADGANVVLDTTNNGAGAGGALTISGVISGTAGGSTEALTLRAGSSSVSVANVYGANGAVDATGLTTLSVISGDATFSNEVLISGAMTVTNSGLFTLGAAGAITAEGGFSTTGAASLANNITTKNAALTIGGDLTIANGKNVTLSTQASAGSGDITLGGTTTGTTGGASEGLVLNAGTGAVSVYQIYGSGGAADATGLKDLTVTSGAASFNHEVKISGALSVTNSGLFTLSSTGGISAAGGVTISGDASLSNDITTSNNALTIGGTVTLGDGKNVTLSTGGGGLTITGSISGASGGSSETLTLNAGSGALSVGAIYGADGTVDATGLTDVTMTSGAATLTNGVKISGALSVTNSGLLTLGNSGEIVANGGVSISGDANLANDITTVNNAITIGGAVTLADGRSVSLSSGGGDISIGGATVGTAGGSSESLTFNAGTGALTLHALSGVDGGADATGLTSVTITNAAATHFAGAILITGALTQTNAATGATTFDGAVSVGAADLKGTSYDINSSFDATGAVTVVNSATLTLSAAGALTAVGGFSASGDVSLANDITTTNSALTIGGSLTLANGKTITLSTQGAAGAGDITISGATNGTSGGSAEALILNAGTGSLSVGALSGANGAVDATGLASVTVVNAGTTSFNGAIAISGLLSQTNAATGGTTFSDTVQVGSADLKGTTFDVNRSFDATGAITVANSGLFTLSSAGAITAAGGFSTTGDVSLANDITTTNTAISIGGGLLVAQGKSVTLSTQGAAGAGDITIGGSTGGVTGGAVEALILNAGTGAVTLHGVAGVDGAQDATGLTSLTVTNAGTTTFAGSIAITGALTQTNAATGATTFDNTVSVGSADLKGTSFDVNNSFDATGTVTVVNSGVFTLSSVGALTAVGGFSTTGDVSLANDVSTTHTALSIGGNLTLVGAKTINLSTQTGGAGAGSISIGGTIEGTTDFSENLTLAAGSGTITLTKAVGGGTHLGDLQVTSDGGFTAAQDMTVKSFTESAGTGASSFQGITTTGKSGAVGGDVSVTTSGAITVAGTITTQGGSATAAGLKGGSVTLSSSGSSVTVAAIDTSGSSAVSGAGGDAGAISLSTVSGQTITLNGDLTANGASASASGSSAGKGGVMTLTGDVVLANNVLMESRNGAVGDAVTGGGITFTGKVDGTTDFAQNLTLSAGNGTISFFKAVGGDTKLGDLSITSDGGLTASADVTAKSFTEVAGTGVTSLQGITTTGKLGFAGGDVSITTSGAITVAGPISALGGTAATASVGNHGGTVSITSTGGTVSLAAVDTSGSAALSGAGGNAGSITVTSAAGQAITLHGNLTANGGNASGSGFAAGKGGAIDFAGNVLLATTIAVESQNGATGSSVTGGGINFGGTVDGTTDFTEGLTLTAGNGTLTFVKVVGGSTKLGDVTVVSDAGLTAAADMTVKSFTQTSGTGTTSLQALTTSGGNGSVGGDVSITTTGAITVAGAITTQGGTATGVGRHGGAVSLTSSGGTISVAAIDTSGTTAVSGAGGDAGAITLTSGQTITLNGNVTANGGSANNGSAAAGRGGLVTLDGNVILGSSVAVESQNGAVGSSVTAGGISFTGTVDGSADFAQNLTLTAGNGAITLAKTVGGGAKLGDFVIASDGGVSASGDITAKSFAETAGSGSTTLQAITTTGNAGAVGGDVSITTSGAITITGSISTQGGTATAAGLHGGAVTLTSTGGSISVAAIDSSGSIGKSGVGGDGGAITVTVPTGQIITLSGDLTADGGSASGSGSAAGKGGVISLAGNVVLANSIAVESINGAVGSAVTGGGISFGGTVDGTSDFAQSLTVTAGNGTVSFTGAVGGGTKLGDILIASDAGLTASADITARSFTEAAGTGSTTLQAITTTGATGSVGGDVTIITTGGIDISGGAITTRGGSATGVGLKGGSVTLTSTGGTVTVAAIDTSGSSAISGAGGDAGAVTISTASGRVVTLNGDITATGGSASDGSSFAGRGGAITFANGASVVLASSVAIESADGTTGKAVTGGGINFTGTVDGTSDYAQNLTLTAGSGTVSFTGAVGGSTKLGDIQIVSDAGLTAAADIRGKSFTETAGTGTTSVQGISTVGDTGADGGVIDITTTGSLTIAGALSSSGGSATGVGRAGGAISLKGDTISVMGIDSSGSNAVSGDGGMGGVIILQAANGITLKGDISSQGGAGAGAGAQGAGGNISFMGPVKLGNTISISTGDTAGDILFNEALDGTSDLSQSLTLTAGTGTVTFNGAVGGGSKLSDIGDIRIVSDGGVTANADMTARSFTEVAGTGTTSMQSINTTGNANIAGGEVNINTTGSLTVAGMITTPGGMASGVGMAGGAVTLKGKTISVAGIDTTGSAAGGSGDAGGAGGAITLQAADGITLNGDIDSRGGAGKGSGLQGAGGTVWFKNAVKLGTGVTISSGPKKRDTLDSTVDGSILFDSTVDGSSEYGESLTLMAGNGKVVFTGAVGSGTPLGDMRIESDAGLTASAAITAKSFTEVAGTDVTSLQSINTSGANDSDGGVVDITTSGSLTINGAIVAQGGSASTVGHAGGAVTLTGDTVTVAGIDTSGSTAVNGAGGAGGAVIIRSTGSTPLILLNGNINTQGGFGGNGGLQGDGGKVWLKNSVQLGHNIAITTGATAGDIQFDGTVDGSNNFAENLTLTAGTGSVLFGGAVGGNTKVGKIQIVSDDGLTAVASIVAKAFEETAGTGNTTLQAITTTGAAGSAGGEVNITTSGAINISGGTITTQGGTATGAGLNGGAVILNSTSGTVKVAAIDTSGSSAVDGVGGDGGAITISSSAGQPITLLGDLKASGGNSSSSSYKNGKGGAIAFNNGGDVVLATSVTMETLDGTTAGAPAVTGGGISFTGHLDGTTDFAQDVTLKAGTGDITFTKDVGSSVKLGAINIPSVNILSAANADITALRLIESNGTGSVQIKNITTNGAVGHVAGDVNIVTAGAIEISGTINAQGGFANKDIGDGYGQAGGKVTLTSTGSTIKVGKIDTSGSSGVLGNTEINSTFQRSGGEGGAITLTTLTNDELKSAEFKRSTTRLITLGGDLITAGGYPQPDAATHGNGGDVTLNGPVTLATGVNSSYIPKKSEKDPNYLLIATNGGDITFYSIFNADLPKKPLEALVMRADMNAIGTKGELTVGNKLGGTITGGFIDVWDLTLGGSGGHIDKPGELFGAHSQIWNNIYPLKDSQKAVETVHTAAPWPNNDFGAFTINGYIVTGHVIDDNPQNFSIPDISKIHSGDNLLDLYIIVGENEEEGSTAEGAGFGTIGTGGKSGCTEGKDGSIQCEKDRDMQIEKKGKSGCTEGKDGSIQCEKEKDLQKEKEKKSKSGKQSWLRFQRHPDLVSFVGFPADYTYSQATPGKIRNYSQASGF